MGAASFSWRNVAASTVAGAVTAGFGSATAGASALGDPVVGAMATGAVGNLSTYAANQLVGNEVGFSWRSVAASAISAGITAKVAPALGLRFNVNPDSVQGDMLAGITGGVVSAHVWQGLIGGGVNYQDVMADAFSNVVGKCVVWRIRLARCVSQRSSGFKTAYASGNAYERNLFAGGGGGPGSARPLGRTEQIENAASGLLSVP